MSSPTPSSAVTVVIPAYRAEATIGEALASVLGQEVAPREVIVVVDASPDRTATVAEKWIREHASAVDAAIAWRVITLPVNRGPAGARNAGMAVAEGDWIAFLDGDDAWLPWRLALQFEALRRRPEAVLVSGDLRLMDSARPAPTAPALTEAMLRPVPLEAFLDDNPVPTSTALARRRVLAGVGGFDERFRGPEDIDLWMRVAAAGPVVRLEAPLCLYRERPGSLSMDPDRFLPQILSVYAKAFAPGGALYAHRRWRRRTIASRLTSAAWTSLACGRRARGLACLLRSWAVWPRRLKIEERRPAWRLILLGKLLLNRP